MGEKRMKKKIVASLLCAAMVLGSLVGCGAQGTSGGTASTQADAASSSAAAGETTEASSAAGDMVTVSLYIPTLAPYTDEAIAEVQNAVNEHLAENYGIQTKLVYTEIGNFEKAINLAMTTDELDVTCYFTGYYGLFQ